MAMPCISYSNGDVEKVDHTTPRVVVVRHGTSKQSIPFQICCTSRQSHKKCLFVSKLASYLLQAQTLELLIRQQQWPMYTVPMKSSDFPWFLSSPQSLPRHSYTHHHKTSLVPPNIVLLQQEYSCLQIRFAYLTCLPI